MNVVLAGNPNAGKTTLFNALTGSNLRTGNFHGVTTSPAKKSVGDITFIDVPGTYSFTEYSMEEVSAAEEIKKADVIVNVVDALTLENSLNLSRKLISLNPNTIVYVTKVEKLKKRGGKINPEKLQKFIGAPVYDCPPKKFKKILAENNFFKKGKTREIYFTENAKTPFAEAYSAGNCTISRADALFYNRFFALFFFIAAICLTFFLAFYPLMPGAKLKDLLEELICVKLSGAICSRITNAAVTSLVSEGVLGGIGGVLSFLPQIAILYLSLILLDESGITSALAFATDGLFEKVNLSGRAAFSLISGFGCTAAAILTTRGYSTEKAQRRTVAILPFIPCGAKLPVFLTFLSPLFKNPFPALTCLYFAGVIVALAASYLMGKGNEGLISEVTPISLPSFKIVLFKLLFELKAFIIKVTGIVFIFCVLSWLFSHYSFGFSYVSPQESMLAAISRALLPLFIPMGITDWRLAYSALCGFIAKENIAATISMLYPNGFSLALAPTLAMCVFVLLCPACVSAFSASCKEVGLKFTLKCFIIQLLVAFAGGYITFFVTNLL